MKILLVTASRHRSTEEIGFAIAEQLRSMGHVVDDRLAVKRPHVDAYDAVVIGSAVYHDRWLPEAQDFVEENRESLSQVPTWLFSSGPLGPVSEPAPHSILELAELCGARDHRMFGGRLRQERLERRERFGVWRMHAEDGDYRSWPHITGWAREIGLALESEPVAVALAAGPRVA